MPAVVVGCLRYLPNKPGQRCGRPVDDGELMMCAEHARYHRNRLRLDELITYGGHHMRREWRTNAGDLRDDWYFYVSEHTQIPDPRHSILERHLREEVDICNAAPFARCTVYRGAERAALLESTVRDERAVSGASTESHERAEHPESTEAVERAVSPARTVAGERAVMDESTVTSERAVSEESTVTHARAEEAESTVAIEPPINWDRFRLSRDDYSHT